MASLQANADSIRAAVGSISTCTPATAALLSDLLLPKFDAQHVTKATSSTKPAKSAAPNSRRKKVIVEDKAECGNHLSPRERSILATEIINSTLKTLSDAIKAPAPGSVRRQRSSKDLIKASARKALRRSNSLPPSPLQPQSLNRISSSPNISTRENRSSSSASITSSGYRSTAECARVAFSCLRTLQASKVPGIDLPGLQLENGMSVLIGKLVSLGLDDLAIKELRVLKRRLNSEDGPRRDTASKGTNTTTAQTLAELLDFGKIPITGAKLGLVVTTQLQVLRVMTSSRNPKHVEAAISVLITTHPSSPTRLLLVATKEAKELKEAEKISRQLQTLSDILLSLTPSVSPADDPLAVEPRLSVSPDVAVQLQTLALHNRFLWWGIAGHKGDLSKEIFDPFLRCLSSFSRRSQSNAPENYRICSSLTMDLMTLLNDCSDSRPRALKSTLCRIYKLLGSLANDANLVIEAIAWTEEYQKNLDPKVDSDARRCSVAARLVSLKLRLPTIDPKDEGLLLNLLEDLECPFKGESSEVDDLFIEVHQARRSAMMVLSKYKAAPGPNATHQLTDGLRQMCESLVFLCPRLSVRYLGKPPDVSSATKDIVRYEQRRYFISKPGINSVDSVLFLVRTLLGEGQIAWDLVDSKLQDCLLLLNRLDLSRDQGPEHDESAPKSHFVRISNIYYSQYLDLRRTSDSTKDGQRLRVLRRSIDSIRTRPRYERKAGQLTTKLERMAEVCKMTSRYDELSKTLSSLQDEMIADGCLNAVAEMAAFRPIRAAWSENADVAVLGRTMQSLLKVQLKYLNPAAQIPLFHSSWSEEEIGAVLEHQLDTLSRQATDSTTARCLLSRACRELISVYDRERFPIRRIRTLLRLYALGVENLEEIVENVDTELDPSSVAELVIEGTKDERLVGYLNHLRAMVITTTELRQEKPRIEVLKEGLSVWSSIRSRCEDVVALERQVDDVPGLITHLHTVGDYLEMKGFDTTRVAVLRLIAELDELSSDESDPEKLVLAFTYLGVQWLQLGYSGKAGLALDRARVYNQQNGVTAFSSLQLHISSSQYLLAIGSLDKM